MSKSRCWKRPIARAVEPRVSQRSSQSRRCAQRSGPNASLPREALNQQLHGHQSVGSDNLSKPITVRLSRHGVRVDQGYRSMCMRWRRRWKRLRREPKNTRFPVSNRKTLSDRSNQRSPLTQTIHVLIPTFASADTASKRTFNLIFFRIVKSIQSGIPAKRSRANKAESQ